jgi:hypothetical protein
MIKESSAHLASESTSNAIPENEKKPIEGATSDSVSKLNMTRCGYTCLSRTGNVAPKLAPKDRKSRTEELLCHLLSFSHALSYEMARYLDTLTFFGKEYADNAAAARGWQIDSGVVDRYVSEARAISAKYKAK